MQTRDNNSTTRAFQTCNRLLARSTSTCHFRAHLSVKADVSTTTLFSTNPRLTAPEPPAHTSSYLPHPIHTVHLFPHRAPPRNLPHPTATAPIQKTTTTTTNLRSSDSPASNNANRAPLPTDPADRRSSPPLRSPTSGASRTPLSNSPTQSTPQPI